jgi:hypothetical protein
VVRASSLLPAFCQSALLAMDIDTACTCTQLHIHVHRSVLTNGSMNKVHVHVGGCS